jgi:hypothetical protein
MRPTCSANRAVLIRALVITAPMLLAAMPALGADMPEAGPPAGDRGYVGRGLDAWRHRRAFAFAEICPDGFYRPPYGLFVPTNDVCDPTYVGSSMGLSRPSYYGALPGPGYDAP